MQKRKVLYPLYKHEEQAAVNAIYECTWKSHSKLSYPEDKWKGQRKSGVVGGIKNIDQINQSSCHFGDTIEGLKHNWGTHKPRDNMFERFRISCSSLEGLCIILKISDQRLYISNRWHTIWIIVDCRPTL